MAIFEYKTHIRYNDINEKNELSDKGILNILSEAAGVHSEIVGYSLNQTEETGLSWMLLFWKVRIHKRPRWNTELTIKTWAREFSRVSSWRDFEVYDENEELIAIATTEWVLINARKRCIARITEDIANKYEIVQKNVFNEELTGKLNEPEDMKKIYEYSVSKRDIDPNHHMNNISYLEIASEVLPDDVILNHHNVEIYYKKQIKFGDTVGVYYSQNNDRHTVCVKSKDGQTLHAVLKIY